MLKRISIANYALIDKLEVDFDDRLNVITGETGAGKSIVIDKSESDVMEKSTDSSGNSDPHALFKSVIFGIGKCGSRGTSGVKSECTYNLFTVLVVKEPV